MCRWESGALAIHALLKAGADVHAQTDDGRTALHWAGHSGRAMSMELSLDHIGMSNPKLRWKCAHDPQTSSSIRISTRNVVTNSTIHSARPRSRPTIMSMRICPPSRWT